MINKTFLVFMLWLTAINFTKAQSALTLEECYRLAKENYPAVKKMELVARSADYTIKNAKETLKKGTITVIR